MEKKAQAVKYKKAPGAPKRFKSAYMFFSENQHKVIRSQVENRMKRTSEVAKMVSQAWKELSEKDRIVWVEKGKGDRERYDREKARYKGPWRIPQPKPKNSQLSTPLSVGKLESKQTPTSAAEGIYTLADLWREADREQERQKQSIDNRSDWQTESESEPSFSENKTLGSTFSAPNVQTNTSHGGSRASSSSVEVENKFPIAMASCLEGESLKEGQNVYQRVACATTRELEYTQPCSFRNQTQGDAQTDQAWHIRSDMPRSISVSSVPNYNNYSLDDALQDESLFCQDFDLSHVPSTMFEMHPVSSLSSFPW